MIKNIFLNALGCILQLIQTAKFKAPSLLATVQHTIAQNTPVSLDIRTAVPGVTIGRGGTQWVFEYSRSCWVHESGIFWMQDSDPRLNEVLTIIDR